MADGLGASHYRKQLRAYRKQGLRLIDFADPYSPKEVGYYEPDPPTGFERASSNDVTIDDRGLIYLVDRQNGVDIISSNFI